MFVRCLKSILNNRDRSLCKEISALFERPVLLLIALALVVSGCGGGSGGADSTDVDSTTALVESGFSEAGIFNGQVDQDSVLLILHEGEFFLLSGDLAGKGRYEINSVSLSGTGFAYRLSLDGNRDGFIELAGTYRTNRHIELTWRALETGEESTTIVEATELYFEESPLSKTFGGWINQDESNLVFLTISENHKPIAGTDLISTQPGIPVSIAVLDNDSDKDGDALQIVAVEDVTALGGTAELDDRGTPDDPSDDLIVYTPPSTLLNDTDSFEYTISDNNNRDVSAKVRITVPTQSVDLSLGMTVDTPSPAVGDEIEFTLILENFDDPDIEVQVSDLLPSGFRYTGDRGGGTYDVRSGFWRTRVPGNGQVVLTITVAVENSGDYQNTAMITDLNAVDFNGANDQASVTVSPTGQIQGGDTPGNRKDAQIEGVILSSLTQISGLISAAVDEHNSYGIALSFSGGGFGGAVIGTEAHSGFAIISDEEVEEELRPAMLILTANAQSVYLNKLFWVSEEELEGDE